MDIRFLFCEVGGKVLTPGRFLGQSYGRLVGTKSCFQEWFSRNDGHLPTILALSQEQAPLG